MVHFKNKIKMYILHTPAHHYILKAVGIGREKVSRVLKLEQTSLDVRS